MTRNPSAKAPTGHKQRQSAPRQPSPNQPPPHIARRTYRILEHIDRNGLNGNTSLTYRAARGKQRIRPSGGPNGPNHNKGKSRTESAGCRLPHAGNEAKKEKLNVAQKLAQLTLQKLRHSGPLIALGKGNHCPADKRRAIHKPLPVRNDEATLCKHRKAISTVRDYPLGQYQRLPPFHTQAAHLPSA